MPKQQKGNFTSYLRNDGGATIPDNTAGEMAFNDSPLELDADASFGLDPDFGFEEHVTNTDRKAMKRKPKGDARFDRTTTKGRTDVQS